MQNITILILVSAAMFGILGLIPLLSHIYNLNGIKSRTVGDGQHGTAWFASRSELRRTYKEIPFEPERWRRQAAAGKTPAANGNPLPQGGWMQG